MNMKHRFVVFVMLLSILVSLSVGVSAAGMFDLADAPQAGNQYYLMAEIEGTAYFYRHTKTGESVTSTAPYSLYLTSNPEDKNIKALTLEEAEGGFQMTYPNGEKTLRIYSYDVDGDGVIDTGVNAASVPDRHSFAWDPETKVLYQMKGDVKYILVAKMLLSSNSGKDEWRMLTVPASEVSDANKVYPVRLAVKHSCTFSEEWASDENSHWHPCFCGEKKDVALHSVAEWTVIKEAAIGVEGSKTGTCTVCGYQVTETIEALAEATEPTTGGEETQPTEGDTPGGNAPQAPSGTIDPIGLAAVIALAVTGLVILIWGKKKG